MEAPSGCEPRAVIRANTVNTEYYEVPGREWDRRGTAGVVGWDVECGYTLGMKTAVSIPDEVFEKVERLARRARRSRSEVFSAALSEYVARHAPDEVTDAMDRVCAEVSNRPDGFVSTAARRILETTEW